MFKVYKLNASPLLSNSLSYIVTKGSCWVEAELFLYNRICPQAWRFHRTLSVSSQKTYKHFSVCSFVACIHQIHSENEKIFC